MRFRLIAAIINSTNPILLRWNGVFFFLLAGFSKRYLTQLVA